jgi:D-xylose transport system ATP-binding protein
VNAQLDSPREPLSQEAAILEVRGIDKHFGATHALRSVSLAIRPGAVHAIVGENGAGKSTLVKIIAGVLPASSFSGQILIEGILRSFSNIRDGERAGVFLVPQELNVVGATTVADNLFLNREFGHFGLVDYRAMWSAAAQWIESLKIQVQPTTPMHRLSAGQQQLVSIARAMTRGVKILILDEPTSSLTEAETDLLFARIAEFHRIGVTTVYISHRLPEIVRLANVVTVMRDGRVVEHLSMQDAATTPRRIVRAMIGRDIEEMFPKSKAVFGDVALEVNNLTVDSLYPGRPAPVQAATLSIRRGEILGVFGVVGSGTSELARAIFGAWPGRVHGSVRTKRKAIGSNSPRQAISGGIGYLSGDRKRSGLVLKMSVAANISLVVLKRVAQRLVISPKRELSLVQHYVDRLQIKIRSVDQSVAELSGGTQQKVMAARWLAASPDVLILEDPTRGIDVGTKAEIYALMAQLAEEGRAILLVSSDLEEVLGISDRMAVMHKGRLLGNWERGSASEEELMSAATGGD